jgi:hypothetical protein
MESQVNTMSANIQRAKGEPVRQDAPAVAGIFSLRVPKTFLLFSDQYQATNAVPIKPGTNVTKQGYLFKKKSSGLKAWGIRWFVLDANGVLTWYKSWKKFTQHSEALNIFYSTVRPSDAGAQAVVALTAVADAAIVLQATLSLSCFPNHAPRCNSRH